LNTNPPKIERYNFGTIVIDGVSYHKDVIIYPDGVYHPWWRKEGHRLYIPDLSPIQNIPLDILIIGTGAFGMMKVSKDVEDEIKKMVDEIRILKTGEAVKLYNEFRGQQRVSVALHLTC